VQYGIGTPKGEVAKNGEEAMSIAKKLGMTGWIDSGKKSDKYRW
jgi:hypothetical protein